jgi:hypothetical protein
VSEEHLAVVLAPETAEEASRLFSALLAGGFHPVIDYGAGEKLANFPILAPQSELAEAKAYLRGVGARPPAPAPAQPQGMFNPNLSDRPVGPLPPWKFSETAGKAIGVLAALIVLVGGIVALVEMLQFLSSLRGR